MTDRQTDRQTDQATHSITIGRILVLRRGLTIKIVTVKVDRLCSVLHSAMCSPRSEPTYTAATYETSAVGDRQADHPS